MLSKETVAKKRRRSTPGSLTVSRDHTPRPSVDSSLPEAIQLGSRRDLIVVVDVKAMNKVVARKQLLQAMQEKPKVVKRKRRTQRIPEQELS
uniref:Transposase n=1 Tax=Panagrellus redivivus TaxID=6233 RepID=A0A7E4VUC5_PANRE